VGKIDWKSDAKGGNDGCGDIIMSGGGGCNVQVPFVDQKDMLCVDSNGDGTLDLGVCFSWRTAGNDDFCTLTKTDANTKGAIAGNVENPIMRCVSCLDLILTFVCSSPNILDFKRRSRPGYTIKMLLYALRSSHHQGRT
jgi:hypothetical protein